MSAEEYNLLRRGHNEALQEQYNVTRWLAFCEMQLSPFIKHKPATPERYAPFPWDGPHEIHISNVSEAQAEELNRLKEDFIRRNEQDR